MSSANDNLGIKGKVLIIIENVKTGNKRTIEVENIVTDAGDVHYAQRGAAESPTNAFGIMELGTAGNAPGKTSNRSDVTTKVTNSQKALDATYPKTNDSDPNNTGSGTKVVSHKVSYATGEANDTNIDRVIITNATPGASEPLKMYAVVTPFTKTSSDTVTIYVNHAMAGV